MPTWKICIYTPNYPSEWVWSLPVCTSPDCRSLFATTLVRLHFWTFTISNDIAMVICQKAMSTFWHTLSPLFHTLLKVWTFRIWHLSRPLSFCLSLPLLLKHLSSLLTTRATFTGSTLDEMCAPTFPPGSTTKQSNTKLETTFSALCTCMVTAAGIPRTLVTLTGERFLSVASLRWNAGRIRGTRAFKYGKR